VATGHELEGALGPSLARFDGESSDPKVPILGFGGFDDWTDGNDVKAVVEGVDLDKRCWEVTLDTMVDLQSD
jgi:hypothetical protein